MMVQSLLRHAMAEAISEGFINCLIVTSVAEANIQLSRIHEHIFARKCYRHVLNHRAFRISGSYPTPSLSPVPLGRVLLSPYPIKNQKCRETSAYRILFFQSISFLVGVVFVGDPTVAAVWRRQTFTAAVENAAPEMTRSIFQEHLPTLAALLNDQPDDPLGTRTVLEDAYRFSRMLHAAAGPARRVLLLVHKLPELGSTLYPREVELAKRCRRSERGEAGCIGATIFPGLVKVSRNLLGPGVASGDTANTAVCIAQVICECALQATSYSGSSVPPTPIVILYGLGNDGNRNTSEFLNLPFQA